MWDTPIGVIHCFIISTFWDDMRGGKVSVHLFLLQTLAVECNPLHTPVVTHPPCGMRVCLYLEICALVARATIGLTALGACYGCLAAHEAHSRV